MPRYQYRCRDCGSMFEIDRPMRDAGVAASCPAGHADTVKLLSTVALTGRGGGGGAGAGGYGGGGGYGASMSGGGGSAGGGCCGGACGC